MLVSTYKCDSCGVELGETNAPDGYVLRLDPMSIRQTTMMMGSAIIFPALELRKGRHTQGILTGSAEFCSLTCLIKNINERIESAVNELDEKTETE